MTEKIGVHNRVFLKGPFEKEYKAHPVRYQAPRDYIAKRPGEAVLVWVIICLIQALTLGAVKVLGRYQCNLCRKGKEGAEGKVGIKGKKTSTL